jgi:hypothetical protein
LKRGRVGVSNWILSKILFDKNIKTTIAAIETTLAKSSSNW